MEAEQVDEGRPIKRKQCAFCKKEIERYVNYCNWDCIVAEAKANGGKIHCPNGLPIRSVDRDGNMWEHEHGDHPDYKFPVDIHYVGPLTDDIRRDAEMMAGRPVTDEEALRMRDETHALIYTDGHIALTMYECNYAVFNLSTGMISSGPFWMRRKEWTLSGPSQKKIQEYLESCTNTRAL